MYSPASIFGYCGARYIAQSPKSPLVKDPGELISSYINNTTLHTVIPTAWLPKNSRNVNHFSRDYSIALSDEMDKPVVLNKTVLNDMKYMDQLFQDSELNWENDENWVICSGYMKPLYSDSYNMHSHLATLGGIRTLRRHAEGRYPSHMNVVDTNRLPSGFLIFSKSCAVHNKHGYEPHEYQESLLLMYILYKLSHEKEVFDRFGQPVRRRVIDLHSPKVAKHIPFLHTTSMTYLHLKFEGPQIVNNNYPHEANMLLVHNGSMT